MTPEPRVAAALPEDLPDGPGTGWAAEPAPAPGWARHAVAPVERLRQRLPIRLDPGRRGLAAMIAIVGVVGALTLVWVLGARPHAIPVQPSSAGTGAGQPQPAGTSPAAARSPAGSTTSGALLVIDVAGKVHHPGLYRLPAGSRVDDAVRAAGGALPSVDLSSLNLAAKLSDGQQIAVGQPGAPAGGPGSGTAPGPTPGSSAPVSLNSASLEQLESLPGVGPVLAQHILDWRSAHGQFSTVEQLREVSGIGESKFATLRPLVSL